jgi:hypothetical protein
MATDKKPAAYGPTVEEIDSEDEMDIDDGSDERNRGKY